jgi:hypothetical protein
MAVPASARSVSDSANIQFIRPDGLAEFGRRPRDFASQVSVQRPTQIQLHQLRGPIYVLNPHKPSGEFKASPAQLYAQPPSFVHTQPATNMNSNKSRLQGSLPRIQTSNFGRGFSNDARLYCNIGLDHHHNESTMTSQQQQNYNKTHDVAEYQRVRTVYVGGRDEEDVAPDKLRSLFAMCGAIDSVHSLYGKNCAFVRYV